LVVVESVPQGYQLKPYETPATLSYQILNWYK
jgi:hypothetical protein